MDKQDRENAINIIEALYPADSGYEDVSKEGRKLLMEAIAQNWRNLPDEILATYETLCAQKEHSQTMESRKRFNHGASDRHR